MFTCVSAVQVWLIRSITASFVQKVTESLEGFAAGIQTDCTTSSRSKWKRSAIDQINPWGSDRETHWQSESFSAVTKLELQYSTLKNWYHFRTCEECLTHYEQNIFGIYENINTARLNDTLKKHLLYCPPKFWTTPGSAASNRKANYSVSTGSQRSLDYLAEAKSQNWRRVNCETESVKCRRNYMCCSSFFIMTAQ